VVVNNIGYTIEGVVEGTPEPDARAQFELNFWAPVFISTAAVRHLCEHNGPAFGGRILNLSSSAGGFMSNPTTAHYSAIKFALEAISEGLQKELDPAWNVRITVVHSGGVRTRWAGANMHELPPPPAYAGPDIVPTKYLAPIRNTPFLGDSAKALVTLADAEIPPAKIPLGLDARVVVQSKLAEVQRELDECKELELSTIADDAD
ncbi:hypothetical protein BD413DRAFT_446835, partial [Trametes elegans]